MIISRDFAQYSGGSTHMRRFLNILKHCICAPAYASPKCWLFPCNPARSIKSARYLAEFGHKCSLKSAGAA